MDKGNMTLEDAKTPEEVAQALAELYPDKIEIEPGKFAVFDPNRGVWSHSDKNGETIVNL